MKIATFHHRIDLFAKFQGQVKDEPKIMSMGLKV